MTNVSTFQPNWVSHPGETITDILNENQITLKQFSVKMECSSEYTKKLLNGSEFITIDIAQKLERVIGASKKFWMNRESQYREDLARLNNAAQESNEWLKKLPLRDMIKFGWISSSRSKAEKETACLEFFNVPNVKSWYETYHELLLITAFRTSSSFDSQSESVITWLRQGEIETNSINCNPWNAHQFRESLLEIRRLTRKKDPQEFVPVIQELFAESGVNVAIVQAPSGCRASGATYFISPERALMLLSFRHLSDDHFWFSLFHEAGHLLLHGNKNLFLENVDTSSTLEEVEANNFAAEILIPDEFQAELKTLNAKNWRQIIRFAKKIGVSPGIVVGQLQHIDLIGHNQLNKLKTRFKWSENIG